MMLFNRKISAQEAHACGLVTHVFPQSTFRKSVDNAVKSMAELPAKVKNSNLVLPHSPSPKTRSHLFHNWVHAVDFWIN